MADRTGARVLTFGQRGDVAWRAVDLDELGRPSFELGLAGEWHEVRLTQSGRHQVANATAAAAMAVAAGVPLTDVATALVDARPASRWRMELVERADGLLVVNDAYNANPASMLAAIETVAGIGARRAGRTIAVLGEMKELGDDAAGSHREVGEAAARAGLDLLVAVGEEAAGIAAGARGAADWGGEAIVTVGRDEAVAWLRKNARAEDVVLVKASRGAGLEVVAEELLEGGTATP